MQPAFQLNVRLYGPKGGALSKEPGNLTWILNCLGNPAVMSVNPKTGGFASPSFDGFALYDCELDSMGIACTRT